MLITHNMATNPSWIEDLLGCLTAPLSELKREEKPQPSEVAEVLHIDITASANEVKADIEGIKAEKKGPARVQYQWDLITNLLNEESKVEYGQQNEMK